MIELDLLIRNGSVIDGTGAPAYSADIGIKGDSIAFIGAAPEETIVARTINAAGMTVAPGFIDIHTHADIALLARPKHLPKVMQGVTTEVFTNCGMGFAPITDAGLDIQRKYIAGLFGDAGGTFLKDGVAHERVDWGWRSVAEFLQRFESQGIGANIAYLIPHGSVRVSAMGMDERSATSSELERMCSLVTQGMEEGAWGLSTGIWYAPMRSADRTELAALCRIAGFFATHQRDYGDAIFEAAAESLAIARDAEVPVQIAHLQMNGPGNAGRAPEILAALDRARQEAVDVTCDTYPYTAGSTFVQSLLPAWTVEGGPESILRELHEPQSRQRIEDHLTDLHADWSRYALVGASSATYSPYEGLRFDDIARRRGITEPCFVMEVLETEELRACFVHHAAHEGNVRDILQWSHQMIGSDGLHLPGKTHPRLFGTFPRVLGRYTREEKLVDLPTAIYKMTGKPAARIGLKRRGTLAIGNAADIVVFDPETIADTATFEDPVRYPIGLPYVFVNGIAAKDGDRQTGSLAGKVLRRK